MTQKSHSWACTQRNHNLKKYMQESQDTTLKKRCGNIYKNKSQKH